MSNLPVTALVERVGSHAAADVLAVVHGAFAARPPLDPPADALAETEESLGRRLGRGRGLLVRVDGRPVGAVVLEPRGRRLFLRRFGVLPQARGHGVAAALLEAATSAGAAHQELAVVARRELPSTVDFWLAQGFTLEPADDQPVARTDAEGDGSPYLLLTRPLPSEHTVTVAEDMRDLGRRVGSLLGAGDLVVLSGELGAGKTTFTQGLGEGLEVRGGVTSPTFVIARVHPSLVSGPDLVHVDAYRLGGIEELDDLDLDTSLDDAVTVVEWGEGIAEGLAEHRLEVRISRALGAEQTDEVDPRVVTFAHR